MRTFESRFNSDFYHIHLSVLIVLLRLVRIKEKLICGSCIITEAGESVGAAVY